MSKHPLEHLTDEQLDQLLDYNDTPFTDTNQEAIKKRFDAKKQRKGKKHRRGFAIAGAAAALLLMTGFTFKDELVRTYRQHFGSDTEILLLNTDRLDQKVEDQGLRLEAVASFKDGDQQYLVSKLTDLTGDRLDKSMTIDRWTMFGGGNTQVVDYDAATKTATLMTTAIGADSAPDSGFLLEAFASKNKDFQVTFTPEWEKLLKRKTEWLDLTKQEAQGGGYDPKAAEKLGLDFDEVIKTGLQPWQAPQQLDQDYSISGTAFKDDLFHLQIKHPNDVKSWFMAPKLVLASGKEVDPVLSFEVDSGTHDNRTGRSDYDEQVFNVTKEELVGAKLVIEGSRWQEYVKGSWPIKLQKTQELPRRTFADQEVRNGNKRVSLKELSLSPISLKFTYTGDLDKAKVILTYKDGKVFDSSFEGSGLTTAPDSSSGQEYTYQFGLHDAKEIQSIQIGDTTLDLTQK